MDRSLKIRIWDFLSNDPKYNGEAVKLETAISMGMNVSYASCHWIVEFSTGEKASDGIEMFEGDIVSNENDERYIVRFGQTWLPFADSRDYCDDIGGEVNGFYLEPIRKKYKHDMNRPLTHASFKVLGNIHKNKELLQKE